MPITLESLRGLNGLEARWRALEAQARGSFFQSWTWLGCLAAERFADPVLLAAEEGGETVALALFNRRRRIAGDTLWLGETGDARLDSVYIEHNGPLLRAGMEAALGPCLRAALLAPLDGRAFGRRVVLGGVDGVQAALAAALPGRAIARAPAQPAPYVDLARLRAAGMSHLAALSANTRYQLRRSARRYEEAGALRLTRAGDVAEGLAFLDALAALHQASWTRRGKTGAFAAPAFLRFHRTLVAEALPRGEVELLRVTAGPSVVGYLLNFHWRGQVLAYQSGFAYPEGDAHRKPGLTSHQLAIAASLEAGADRYDFLAGAGRYKTSLANAEQTLHWLELGPSWRPAALRDMLRRAVTNC